MDDLQKTWSVIATARQQRIPGQVARLSPELERTLTMPKEPTKFAWLESRIRVPGEVLDGLGLPGPTEQLLEQRVRDLVRQSADELSLRRNLMEEMMHSGVPGPVRGPILKRASELYRSSRPVRKAQIVTPDEVLKAGARGGRYHKRVTSPEGRHRYFYKPEDYERSHGKHVSGPEAQLTHLQDALTKRLKGSPDGIPIADLQSMVRRHGADKVHQALRAMKGCVYKGGKLMMKSERFMVLVPSDPSPEPPPPLPPEPPKVIRKSRAFPVGHVSTHGGVRVRKVAPGKWTPVGDQKKKPRAKPIPKRKPKGAIELPAATKGLPPKKYQPVMSKQELYRKAKVAQKDFEALMGKVSALPGFRKIDKKPPAKFASELEKPGGVVLIASIKKGKRADQKVRDDYGGDWSQLRDVVRGTVAVDKLEDVESLFSKLEASGVKYASRGKDRVSKPAPGGYRDVMLHLELPNGIVAELQIHLKPMLRAKEVGPGHKYYEQIRSILSDLDRRNRKPRPKEAAALSRLGKMSEDLYGKAWNEIIGKG